MRPALTVGINYAAPYIISRRTDKRGIYADEVKGTKRKEDKQAVTYGKDGRGLVCRPAGIIGPSVKHNRGASRRVVRPRPVARDDEQHTVVRQ